MELDPITTGAGFSDRVRWCVSVARFAPSKHNAQPWRFAVDGGAVELYADATRSLRSDPDDRELTIACGAALRTYSLALRALGVEPFVALLPDGPDGPLARIVEARRRPATEADLELLRAVPHRHTNRGPLDADAMRQETPFHLQRTAEAEGTVLQLVMAPGARRALEQVLTLADAIRSWDDPFAAELRAWTRTRASRPADGMPVGAGLPPGAAYGARFALRTWRAGSADPVPAGPIDRPLPAVLWTAGDGQVDWLRAGAAVQMVLLRATVEGAAASFMNQALEHQHSRAAVRRQIGFAGFPQSILRLGVGTEVVGTTRRPVEEILSV